LHLLSSAGKQKGLSEHGKILGEWSNTFSYRRKELRARKKANVSIEIALLIIFLPAVSPHSSLTQQSTENDCHQDMLNFYYPYS